MFWQQKTQLDSYWVGYQDCFLIYLKMLTKNNNNKINKLLFKQINFNLVFVYC